MNTLKPERFLSLTLLLLWGVSAPVFSAQTFVMNEHERLEARISSKELNRLQVTGERIASVFGSQGTFSLEHEEVKGQVFLKVQEGAPSRMDVSVVTESGLTQDLVLRVMPGEGQTLLLKPSKSSTPSSLTWSPGTQRDSSETLELIRVMASKGTEFGYHRQIVSQTLSLWRDVEVRVVEIWRGEGLEGRVYEVRNRSQEILTLQEKRFRFSSGTQAIAVEKHRLSPGERTRVYGVTSHV